MPRNKTQPTAASVADHLASRASAGQADDSRMLLALLERVTGHAPVMWGPSIVGFDRYRYVYDSGRTGEAPVVGFAIRGREIVLYLAMQSVEQQRLLARLGPHRVGKVCLYLRRLAEVDLAILEALVRNSVAEVRRLHA